MNPFWLNSVLPIATLFSFRMLGLFMLIPVFTIYANQLDHATPTLIGIALGSYGLTQGLLQMPFGLLSDRFGRKPIITIGLILFAAGSLLGAFTTSIYGMILARILQGTGAIGSVLIALLADLTPDTQRTKAMAVIGMSIGFSFSLAMVLSPALTAYAGLAGIFYFTAVLAILGLFLLHGIIPSPQKEPFHLDSEANPALFKEVLKNASLQRLNAGIFCQHFILTATFFSVPILLQRYIQSGHLTQSWHFYLPLMLFSFLLMLPLLIVAEKKQKTKTLFIVAIGLTGLCQLGLAFSMQSWFMLCSLMFLYFVVFNILEANLPSLISKQASAHTKGTAMGIYSSCQFLGIFAGGSLSGLLYQYAGNQGIFIINSLMALLWFTLARPMQPQDYQINLILHYESVHHNNDALAQQLKQLPGVDDVFMSPEEGTIYLRVNKAQYQTGSAEKIIESA